MKNVICVGFIIIFVLFFKIQTNHSFRYQPHPDSGLLFPEVIKKYGYPLETHSFATQDGYILNMFRIPRGKNNKADATPNEHPILMVHGTCGCSDNFIIAGNGKAIVYYLADRNFDVWVVNTRGNRYSRTHQWLDPDKHQKYWDHSWHEVGVYDTTSAIDYVLQATNKTKLFYLGMSQGTTSYYAMASDRPEYNDKIILAVNFAPSAYLDSLRNLVKFLGKHGSLFKQVLNTFDVHEVFPFGISKMLNTAAITLCGDVDFFADLCNFILYFGEVSGDMEKTTPQFVLTASPAGCSVDSLVHYFQIVRTGNFTQFDRGPAENIKRYGTSIAPSYDLTNISTPIALFYAKRDNIAPSEGAIKLSKILPNVAMLYEITDDSFNHVDFLFGKNVIKFINDPLYKLLLKYVNNTANISQTL